MKIFVLEDDNAIGIGLTYSLNKEGYEVTLAKTVREAENIIAQTEFELYILDLTLPDGSGYDICRRIKAMGDYPIIFLTAYDDEVNVVMGLELGADDYISKPFRIKELTARIKSVLRRYNKNGAESEIRVQDMTVLTNKMKVIKNGREIILTAMEYRLLMILINNRGTVLSRSILIENLWDIDGDFVNDNTLTVYIKRLRDKIETEPNKPKIIKTIKGLGYVIENE